MTTVREATLEDAQYIARIGATTFVASFAWSLPQEDVETYLQTSYSTDAIAREMSDVEHNKFFVSQADNSGSTVVTGFIQMKLGTTEPCIPDDAELCEVHRIYVDANRLGGGAGKILLDTGLRWAEDLLSRREARVPSKTRRGIWLGVWEENPKAQRFYSRFGFEKIGAHDFVTGNTRQTDEIMIKWIDDQN